jgi:hypothetical protein
MGAWGNCLACTSSIRIPVKKMNGVPFAASRAATPRLFASGPLNFTSSTANRLAAKKRERFRHAGCRSYVFRSSQFECLLNVEGDQEFIVQHKTALAGKQSTRLWQGWGLWGRNFPFSYELL